MALFTPGLFDCRDAALVGGKAVNLGRLIRAGFPVPGGFVINTLAYGLARARSSENVPTELPAEVADEIRAAYRTMGAGAVAVRSSATAEDLANASMAGQYETFLDIQGEDDLLDAVRRCWASLDSPRIRAYLREHQIDLARVAMAVVVQRLVSADVAGVLFTANPNESAVGAGHNGTREMLVEASWGLGESVVSGRVQPDVLRLEQESGRVVAATIADKRVHLSAGAGEEQAVEESRRRLPCLRGRDVHRLWQLGRRTAQHFGAPQDIEWAIHGDELFLLQSRPITTRVEADAREELLRTTRQHLRQELAAGRGPWVTHNLAETLPHPTTLTWSIISRFMSGAGGYGNLYRQAGFAPAPSVMAAGFLDRIAGRIYMDAARAPEMFFANFPYAYDIEELKRSPDVSQSPPTLPRGTAADRKAINHKLAAVNEKLTALSLECDRDLRDTFFPDIADYATAGAAIDLTRLSAGELVALWQQHEKQVLDTFGPQSLLSSLISGMALSELRNFIADVFWQEDPDALAQQISSGGISSRTVIADAELYEVAKGTRPLESWLADHGHRASGEFDLANPRWREQPEAAREMASHLAKGESPMDRHRRNGELVQNRIQDLRARLSAADCREFDRCVDLVRRYVAFREDGKDYLMRGYELLRGLALEAGRRLEIGNDVFHLTREELFDALIVGYAPLHLLEQRSQAYRAEARLTLPRLIDAAAIDTLGALPLPPTLNAQGGHKAFAISAGAATGPVRILKSPTEAGDLGTGYVLVCPSTDPSWTPLFVNAAALVLECGGTLSHGAVVAREMGLPAVVLPDATRLFAEGQQIHVDGSRGWVGPPPVSSPASDQPASPPATTPSDPNDLSIPQALVPPPAGSKDRHAAKVRNIFALVWALYLLAFFLLPRPWVYQPTLAAIDIFLWPIARTLGKPAVVVIVAAIIALATLLLQKFTTDNRRLLEAKRRAALLKRQADALPRESPRRALLLRLAAPVQFRTLMAAMVPVGILLGPMVMPFVWFKERIDPAVWNAPAGSPVQIVATIDSNWSQPIELQTLATVTLDDSTPAARTLPPLRPTLERLLALYRRPQPDAAAPGTPWELQTAPDLARQQTIDDLQAYLDSGIPPQGITWLVHPPADFNGQFPITLTVAGHPPTALNITLGEKNPPAPATIAGPAGSPIKELRVVYPPAQQEKIFLRPLHFLARYPALPGASKLAAYDIGWLWLYILAYLPILLAARLLLKVA